MSCAFWFCRWKLSPPFGVDLRRDVRLRVANDQPAVRREDQQLRGGLVIGNDRRPDLGVELLAAFDFHEDGRADGAVILLVGAEGEQSAIEVAPLTGRAALQESY